MDDIKSADLIDPMVFKQAHFEAILRQFVPKLFSQLHMANATSLGEHNEVPKFLWAIDEDAMREREG